MADFYDYAAARLAAAGYDHYEISNWGLPGRHSQHNLKYWRREPYLGLGAGAHSFDGGSRWANVHEPARYVTLIERGVSAREQFETVLPPQALQEEFFLGLRQLEGIDFARIERDYSFDPQLGDRLAVLRDRIDYAALQWLHRSRRPAPPHRARPPHGFERNLRPIARLKGLQDFAC